MNIHIQGRIVILIEDCLRVGEQVQRCLCRHGFEVRWARTFQTAREVLTKDHSEAYAVIFDYQLDDGNLSTPLVHELKSLSFKGKMIAMSDQFNHVLINAGCSYAIEDKVLRVSEQILDILRHSEDEKTGMQAHTI